MRAYYYDLDEFSFAITAPTLKRARQILWQDVDMRDCCEGLWINMSLRWVREARVDDLPEGHIIEAMDGIERDVYTGTWDSTCPVCHTEHTDIGKWDGVISCFMCYRDREAQNNP